MAAGCMPQGSKRLAFTAAGVQLRCWAPNSVQAHPGELVPYLLPPPVHRLFACAISLAQQGTLQNDVARVPAAAHACPSRLTLQAQQRPGKPLLPPCSSSTACTWTTPAVSCTTDAWTRSPGPWPCASGGELLSPIINHHTGRVNAIYTSIHCLYFCCIYMFRGVAHKPAVWQGLTPGGGSSHARWAGGGTRLVLAAAW